MNASQLSALVAVWAGVVLGFVAVMNSYTRPRTEIAMGVATITRKP